MGVPGAIVGDVPPSREDGFDETTGDLALVDRYRDGLREVAIDEVRT